MASAHQTFARHPTNNRGVLTCDEFAPLTLEGVELTITTVNLAARVTLRCEFKNNTGRTQDVFAAFSQIPSWDLCSMRCEGGKQFSVSNVVKAETHEHVSYATETYVPNVVTQVVPWQVLNLETVLVSATFLAPLALSDAQTELSLLIPKALFPERVEPPATKAEFGNFFIIPTPSKIPRAVFVGAKGAVSGVVGAPPTITGFTRSSAKSQGNVSGDKRSYSVKAEDTDKSLGVVQDLTLTIPVSIAPKDPLTVAVARETSPLVEEANKFAVETTFAPVLTANGAENSEVILLVDGSASMRQYLAAVQRALRVAVAGLPTGVFFNIVRYGAKGTVEWRFPKGSEELSAATRAAVLDDYIPNLRFDLNNASLLSAIRAVYETPFITGFVRNVVLVTDSGEEKYGPRVVEITRANVHSTRFSAIALGPSAQVAQLRLAATHSNGLFRAIPDAAPDAILGALVGTLAAVIVPTLTHVSLRLQATDGSDGPPPIRQASTLLPVVPTGGRLVTYGIASDSLKDFTATLSGLIGAAHCEYKYTCANVRDAPTTHQSDDALTVNLGHAAAAQARLRGLVDFHTRSTLTAAEQQEVAALGANFFLPTPFTRFSVRSHNGPVGFRGVSGGYIPSKLAYTVPIVPTRDISGLAVNADAAEREATLLQTQQRASLSNKEFCNLLVQKLVSSVCAATSDAEELLDGQREDGAFRPTARFFAAVGISFDTFTSRRPSWADEETWATSLGIVAAEKLEGGVAELALRKARLFITARSGAETVNAARRTLM